MNLINTHRLKVRHLWKFQWKVTVVYSDGLVVQDAVWGAIDRTPRSKICMCAWLRLDMNNVNTASFVNKVRHLVVNYHCNEKKNLNIEESGNLKTHLNLTRLL